MALTLQQLLFERDQIGRPVVVGLVGAGQMGTDLVVQLGLMSGIKLGAIAVRTRVEQAMEVAVTAGYDRSSIVVASSSSSIDRAIEHKQLAITDDLSALTGAGRVDVIIDATGHPETGAKVACSAIEGGKHIVMLNVEADVTVGRHLHRLANRAGVIYTGAAGDEPAAAAELVAFARSLGMRVVAAGKGKNNSFNHDAVPRDYQIEARSRNMNPRVLVEFVDGTKTMVEMTALANATGLVPDQPGMHGPNATKDELADVFRLVKDGGVLSKKGVVDFTVGKGVAPGVFCVVEPTHPRVLERLTDLHVGKGPLFTLHRPYHLTSLETPLTAARAVLLHQSDLVPLESPVAEACAIAKRDLEPGAVLGRIGEADYRGWAMTWEAARAVQALPIGLVENSRAASRIRKGELLSYANCFVDESLTITRLRRELDARDEARLRESVGVVRHLPD